MRYSTRLAGSCLLALFILWAAAYSLGAAPPQKKTPVLPAASLTLTGEGRWLPDSSAQLSYLFKGPKQSTLEVSISSCDLMAAQKSGLCLSYHNISKETGKKLLSFCRDPQKLNFPISGRQDESGRWLGSCRLPNLTAGAYFVEASAAGAHDRQILIVSSIVPVCCSDPSGRGFVWYVNANTGLPAVPESIHASCRVEQEKPIIHTLHANQGGIVDLSSLPDKGRASLTASCGGHLALCAIGSAHSADCDWKAYVFPDKEKYAPGEQLHWKAVIRLIGENGYSVPSSSVFKMSLLDNTGNTVAAVDAPTGNKGTVRGDFMVPAQATPGIWSLTLTDSDGIVAAAVPFAVAAKTKNKLNVALQPSANFYLTSDTAVCALDIHDSADHPVQEAICEWRIWSQPTDRKEISVTRLPWYRADINGNERREAVPGHYTAANPLLIKTTSNSLGHSDMSVPVASVCPKNSNSTLCINVAVKTKNGDCASSGLVLAAAKTPFQLYIDTDETVYANRSCDVAISLSDSSGTPVSAEVTVKAADENSIKLLGKVKTDRFGRADLRWTPQHSGPVTLLASAGAGLQRQGDFFASVDAAAQSSSIQSLNTSASTEVTVKETDDNTFLLELDKDYYNPGDTAEVTMLCPRPGRAVLVTVESGTVEARFVVTPKQNESVFRLPIASRLFPACKIKARFWDEQQLQTAETEVYVPSPAEIINIQLNTLDDKVCGQPGKVSILTTDQSGKPVSAEVALALSAPLSNPLPPSDSMLTAFYGEDLTSRVVSGIGVLGRSTSKINVTTQNDLALMGGNSFWIGEIRTDTSGKAEMAVNWPDKAGRWSLFAIAVSGERLMGESLSYLELNKKLNLRITGPIKLRSGDLAGCRAEIENLSSEVLPVELTVKSTDSQAVALLAKGTAAKQAEFKDNSLKLAPHQRAAVNFEISAGLAGKADLQVTASAQGIKYREVLNTVVSPVAKVLQSTKTIAVEQDSTLKLTTFQPRFIGKIAERKLSVEFLTGLSGTLATVAASLSNSPASCEGLVARFAPSGAVIATLKAAGLQNKSDSDHFLSNMKVSLSELSAAQNKDGGFGWWPNMPSDFSSSVVVGSSLAEMDALGYRQVQPVLKRTNAYLLQTLPRMNADEKAFALWSLALAKQAPREALLALKANMASLSPSGRICLALALGRSRCKPEAVFVWNYHVKHSDQKSSSLNWSKAEQLAWQLLGTLSFEPKSPEVDKLVNKLILCKHPGSWQSIRESMIAVEALASTLKLHGGQTSSYGYGVWINDNEVSSGQIRQETWSQPKELTYSAAQLPDSPLSIHIIKGGQGKVWACAKEAIVLAYSPNDAKSWPQSQANAAFTISRTFYEVNAKGQRTALQPGSKVNIGSVLDEDITLKAKSGTLPERLVVNESLPGGFMPLGTYTYVHSGNSARCESNVKSLLGLVDRLYIAHEGRSSVTLRLRGKAATKGEFTALPVSARQAEQSESTVYGKPFRLTVTEQVKSAQSASAAKQNAVKP